MTLSLATHTNRDSVRIRQVQYRKKELNNFVNFTSETVYYHGKNNLGDLGIEGSKPGSAASAVHMANKVIVSFVNFIF